MSCGAEPEAGEAERFACARALLHRAVNVYCGVTVSIVFGSPRRRPFYTAYTHPLSLSLSEPAVFIISRLRATHRPRAPTVGDRRREAPRPPGATRDDAPPRINAHMRIYMYIDNLCVKRHVADNIYLFIGMNRYFYRYLDTHHT